MASDNETRDDYERIIREEAERQREQEQTEQPEQAEEPDESVGVEG